MAKEIGCGYDIILSKIGQGNEQKHKNIEIERYIDKIDICIVWLTF